MPERFQEAQSRATETNKEENCYYVSTKRLGLLSARCDLWWGTGQNGLLRCFPSVLAWTRPLKVSFERFSTLFLTFNKHHRDVGLSIKSLKKRDHDQSPTVAFFGSENLGAKKHVGPVSISISLCFKCVFN